MHVRTATGTPVPTTSPQPVPVPPRWHLRTQVSRKTLFDLIQDTLPPAGLQVSSAPDAPAAGGGATAPGDAEAGAASGVLPQSYLDALAATVPMPLHPAALWNDGDTTPDISEHWRPITITLASTPALPPPVLAPPPAPPRPLQGAVKTAGWMLAGAALTFLVSAAAFGGRPMLRAIRGVTAPHAQTTTEAPIPATQTAPAPAGAPTPQRSPALTASASVVAVGESPAAPIRAVAAPAPPFALTVKPEGEGGPDADHGDRRTGGASSRASHRARQDRRLVRSATLTDAGRISALDADDAVMPLESVAVDGHADVAAKRAAPAKPAATPAAPATVKTPAMARTLSSRVSRPIDVEDPFGGR